MQSLKLRHISGLGTGQATINLDGRNTKDGKADTIPLSPVAEQVIVQRVQDFKLKPDDCVIVVSPVAAEMIRRDARRAGLTASDNPVEKLTFHSLRRTFITWLAVNGCHPKLAQRLARHSSVSLTMDVYTSHDQLDSRKAVEGLSGIVSPSVPLVSSNQMVSNSIKLHSGQAESGMNHHLISTVNTFFETTCVDIHKIDMQSIPYKPD